MNKLFPVLTIMIAIFFLAFSGAPNDVRTQAPGDNQTCQNCHGFDTGDGSLLISGVPSTIVKGETYTITLTLTDPGQSEGGFQMVATDGINNTSVGTFAASADTRIISSGSASGRITHNSPSGFSGSSTSWSFDWTAPSAPTTIDNIQFYAVGNAVNGNNNTGGDFVYFAETGTLPLPVEWAYLKANQINDDVLISWGTLTEINNEYFEIERSRNNKDFQVIGKEQGRIFSYSLSEYSFLDNDLISDGRYYYRIKQIDLDGGFKFSNIVSIDVIKGKDFVAYPNPTSSILNIDTQRKSMFTIFNQEGRAIDKVTVDQYNSQIDFSSLQTGVYILMDELGNFERIVKK